jgi:integration host factor subunit alpha
MANMIADDLVANNEVKVSNFGTFAIRQKKERIGRNPRTNAVAVISPRKVVVFRPYQKLKELDAVRSK